MTKFILPALVASIILMPLHSLGSPREVTLEQCLEMAAEADPAIRGARLEVEKANVLKRTAFDPAQTEITLKQETTGGGGPDNGVYFGQEFDFPSLYVARHKALSARSDLEQTRLLRLLSDLETEVMTIYNSALYYRSLLQLTQKTDSLYSRNCNIVAIRVEEGTSRRLELINSERVRDKNRLEQRNVAAEYANALSRLRLVTGSTEEICPVAQEYLPLPYLPSEFDFDKTAAGAEALGEIRVADREVTVAKNEFMPGLHVGATVQALIKGFNPYHVERLPFEKGNFMGLEVGITVPLFFGAGSARLKAARLDQAISRLNMENLRLDAVNERERLDSRLRTLREGLDFYEKTELPRALELKDLAEISYELGDIEYMEYISNMELYFAINREYLEHVNDYNETVINLLRK